MGEHVCVNRHWIVDKTWKKDKFEKNDKKNVWLLGVAHEASRRDLVGKTELRLRAES